MSLRVISGIAKGRKLKLVPGDSTRPIMDRAKEALFSILGQGVVNAAFLDLFAGTGSVGIEALSRGAAHGLFIEIDRKAIQTIHDNLKHTRLDANATVRMQDAFELLRRPPDMPYDYIFVAPPQYHHLWRRTLETLDAHPAWIHDGITVIVQVDPTELEPINLHHLVEYDRRRYGKTLLLFYAATAAEGE
jgi:16S rRNA (guanine(966)-N(2))-methyltransferase RsmD